MNFVPVLSTIILVSTLVTILLAILSFAAYKIREQRKPSQEIANRIEPFSFFRRYRLHDDQPSTPTQE